LTNGVAVAIFVLHPGQRIATSTGASLDDLATFDIFYSGGLLQAIHAFEKHAVAFDALDLVVTPVPT
jgi:hypothetical protein